MINVYLFILHHVLSSSLHADEYVSQIVIPLPLNIVLLHKSSPFFMATDAVLHLLIMIITHKCCNSTSIKNPQFGDPYKE